MRPSAGCKVNGCPRKHVARGYCGTHYKREVVRADAVRRSQPIHLEDVEWLAETGEVWERAIQRLDTREDTLRKFLERQGRYDLIRTLRRRVAARTRCQDAQRRLWRPTSRNPRGLVE